MTTAGSHDQGPGPDQPTDAPIGKVWEEQGTPGRPIDRRGEHEDAVVMADEFDQLGSSGDEPDRSGDVLPGEE